MGIMNPASTPAIVFVIKFRWDELEDTEIKFWLTLHHFDPYVEVYHSYEAVIQFQKIICFLENGDFINSSCVCTVHI